MRGIDVEPQVSLATECADLVQRIVQAGGGRACVRDQRHDLFAVSLDPRVRVRQPVWQDYTPLVNLQRIDSAVPHAHDAGCPRDGVMGLSRRQQCQVARVPFLPDLGRLAGTRSDQRGQVGQGPTIGQDATAVHSPRRLLGVQGSRRPPHLLQQPVDEEILDGHRSRAQLVDRPITAYEIVHQAREGRHVVRNCLLVRDVCRVVDTREG